MMRNSSLGPYVPAEFSPPDYIVIVNALFYASLGVMLLAALIAMLIKSWVREFDRGLRAMSLPEQRAKTREFRYVGIVRWKLPQMVSILPFLIQISLLLFAIGLVIFLFHISKPSFVVITLIVGVGVLYYAITTSISVFVTSSPFHSPLSRALSTAYQVLHAYFCPKVEFFLSPAMDTTPTTALGRVMRNTAIFFWKSRPFRETDFVEPIATTTIDEFQLSTAASALQRIHNSVPNSQHSELVHRSVWQTAGSPTFGIPPLFNLPSWIIDRRHDREYFSRAPPASVVAFMAVSLRTYNDWVMKPITAARNIALPVGDSNRRWAQLVDALFILLHRGQLGIVPLIGTIESETIGEMVETASDHLANMIRRKELRGEESLWLLNMLSELEIKMSLPWVRDTPISIEICLAMLWDQVPKWGYGTDPRPDVIVLETVVTLAAISLSTDRTYQEEILTNSHQHPWLLLNLRSPALISKLLENAPSSCHKQLASLLFLVAYALMHRRSEVLASQYITLIATKVKVPIYTSALASIAPAIGKHELSVIVEMLVGLGTNGYRRLSAVLTQCDLQLGGSSNLDPSFLAILLLLSKSQHLWTSKELPHLENPSLRLAARVMMGLAIHDGPDIAIRSFSGHRVHNMVAALSLLRYAIGTVTQYTESLLLASFLESREPSISSLALEYYLRTIISYPEPPAPSRYLSGAIRAVFNLVLTDHQLQMGWKILHLFVDGFEKLPVEWRRTFAEAFFTLSHQPLPRPRGDTTPESELTKILTWEYFHEEGHEFEFTEAEVSGLDWMVVASSIHLSQRSEIKIEHSAMDGAQLSASAVDDEFVLRALCKLLDAAPYYQIIPTAAKLCEFVRWFDDTKLVEYRGIISARIEQAVRSYQVLQMPHEFHRFQCMRQALRDLL
jgi:hypothetical protein